MISWYVMWSIRMTKFRIIICKCLGFRNLNENTSPNPNTKQQKNSPFLYGWPDMAALITQHLRFRVSHLTTQFSVQKHLFSHIVILAIVVSAHQNASKPLLGFESVWDQSAKIAKVRKLWRFYLAIVCDVVSAQGPQCTQQVALQTLGGSKGNVDKGFFHNLDMVSTT